MRLTGISIFLSALLTLSVLSCTAVSPQMKMKFDRQEGGVNDLAISPDGTTVASASTTGSIYIFNIESGDIVRSMEGHKREATTVVYHPTGRYIISGSRRGLKFWEASSGKETGDFKVKTQMVRALDITPSGEFILTGNSNNFLELWRGFDGSLVYTFKQQPFITDLEISPDSHFAISTSGQGSVMVWDLEKHCLVRQLAGHADYVSSVAFSPDGKFAVSGGWDSKINIYNMETGEVVRVIENPKEGVFSSGAVNSVDWSPDNIHILSAGRNRVMYLWEAETGRLVRTFRGHTAEITVAQFTSDGNYIISGDKRGAIRVWDIWMEPVEAVQETGSQPENPT